MADKGSPSKKTEEQASGTAPIVDTASRDWRNLWQLPAAILGGLMLIGATALAIMTAPTPSLDEGLEYAERLIENDQITESIEFLNSNIWPFVPEEAKHVAPEAQRARYHQLLARAIALGNGVVTPELDANHNAVRQSYREAVRLQAKLDSRDVRLYAVANAALARYSEAIELADSLAPAASEDRYRIYQMLVTRSIAGRDPQLARAQDLLATMAEDPELRLIDPGWVLIHQSEVLLEQGYSEDAIARILRTLPRIRDETDPERLAKIYTLLGQAYLESGAFTEAERHLGRAGALMPGQSEDRGVIELSLAQIEEMSGRLSEARDRYAMVRNRYAGPKTLLRAMLGYAETTSALGDYESATSGYRELVDKMNEPTTPPTSGVTRDRVSSSLLDRFSSLLTSGDPAGALDFARMALDLYSIDEAPAPVLLATATGHRTLAESRLPDGARSNLRSADMAAVDQATRREAQRHLISAGEFYRMHADRMVLTSNAAYADSLWNSSESFDRAGDLDAAILGFQQFVTGVPSSPKRAEGQFRLAQALQARGSYGRAAELYRALISERLAEGGDGRAGPFAEGSYVPLAQSLLLDESAANDEEAERLLLAVINGEAGGPEAEHFRRASIELGRRYYATDRFERAIEQFERILDRDPEQEDAAEVRFLLADAYRLSADEIEGELEGSMADSRRLRLQDLRPERLRRAMQEFERVRRDLASRDPRRLTTVQRQYLQNASFYLGDCAFDLGEYDLAIELYDAAKERYEREPASLVAMIQIVSAHVAKGELEMARTANNRAKTFFASLPEDVWTRPDLPMSRGDWERWLESSERIYSMADGG